MAAAAPAARGPSAYNLCVKMFTAELKEQVPDSKERFKAAVAKWKELNDEERDAVIERAKAFNEANPTEPKAPKREKKKPAAAAAAAEPEAKPKKTRAPTDYNNFVRWHMMTADKDGKTVKERMTAASAFWKILKEDNPDELKAKLVEANAWIAKNPKEEKKPRVPRAKK